MDMRKMMNLVENKLPSSTPLNEGNENFLAELDASAKQDADTSEDSEDDKSDGDATTADTDQDKED